MHPLSRQIAQRLVHHPLPHNAVDACKGYAFYFDSEMAFTRAIIARMAMMLCAVIDHGKARGGEGGGQQRFHFGLDGAFCHARSLPISAVFRQGEIMSAPRNPDRFHGRMHWSRRACARPGCPERGEFRAPNPYGRQSGPNGPGDYQWLCLDHVREFNAGYDWFAGMSAEEIARAQSPLNVWPSETRAFRANGNVDSPPRWADFNDPLEAISARFNGRVEEMKPATSANGQMLSGDDKRALRTLGLGHDADRRAVRSAYSRLVRKYHPDKNGGDRTYEKALQEVIAAYTHLKSSPALSR
jgi:hypothetical protein